MVFLSTKLKAPIWLGLLEQTFKENASEMPAFCEFTILLLNFKLKLSHCGIRTLSLNPRFTYFSHIQLASMFLEIQKNLCGRWSACS